jgi:hypothetical protein
MDNSLTSINCEQTKTITVEEFVMIGIIICNDEFMHQFSTKQRRRQSNRIEKMRDAVCQGA